MLREAIAANKDYIDACLLEDTTVVCINRETKKNKRMSFKVMYVNNSEFWLKNELWEYFLVDDEFKKLQKRAAELAAQWEQPELTRPDPVMPKATAEEVDEGFGKDFVDFAAMSEAERVERMKSCKTRLDTLISQKPRQEQLITEALVQTTQDTILYNYASLMNTVNLSSAEAKNQTQNLVDSTNDLVKASSQLISANIFNNDLMHTLVAKSNGAIIQHMTRVYLRGLAFISYYNKLVSTSSMINKLRIAFAERYLPFYQSLLPHIHPEDISLERVFLGGMRAIPESIFYNWAIGFLMHDIGKAAAVEYHEGEAAYNHEIVMEHVKLGYASIMNKTNYPLDVGLIAGYHHEYYGDPSGYGLFRLSLESAKKTNPQIKPDYCISYDIDPMTKFEARAFFPAKVLEIIDVCDALTDPNRKYRKALPVEEAIDVMKQEFVDKHHKIDAILFDIFTRFVKEAASA